MTVIDRRAEPEDWAPVVSADPEAWSNVDLNETPDVAYTDVSSVDELLPAPEEVRLLGHCDRCGYHGTRGTHICSDGDSHPTVDDA